jgi:hypothetical protein
MSAGVKSLFFYSTAPEMQKKGAWYDKIRLAGIFDEFGTISHYNKFNVN